MRVLIIINPFASHFLSILDFASRMSEEGNQVILAGYGATKNIAQKYGFEYYTFEACNEEPSFKDKELIKQFNAELECFLEKGDFDLVCFHVSRFLLYFAVINRLQLNILLYTSCCGADRINCFCPPSTYGYLPSHLGHRNIYVLILWIRRFLRIERYRIKNGNRVALSTYLHFSRDTNKKLLYGIDGFSLDYPKLILGPQKINLYSAKNSIFWGLGVSPKRKTTSQSFRVKGKKNIYCTFGTLNYRYIKLDSFLKILITVMKKRTDWNLLLQYEGKLDEDFYQLGNIKILPYVNQLDVIKDFDVVIFHGGFGTLKECIYFEKPMLVLPCSYDQHGNAARIAHYEIGIRNIALVKSTLDRILKRKSVKCTAEEIEEQIEALIVNPKYKRNISALKQYINDEKEAEKACDFLKKYYG